MAKPTKHHGKWRIRWKDATGKRRSATFTEKKTAELAGEQRDLGPSSAGIFTLGWPLSKVSGKVSSDEKMGRSGTKLRLSRSPLSLVLAQVRFERLEAFAEYVPKIQDRLRRSGYPVNKSGRIAEVQLTAQGSRGIERPHWEVLSEDRRSGVVLTPEFVVMQTTDYRGFEEFLDSLVKVTQQVNEVVDGLYVRRLGLRYVDAIQPEEGEGWRDYIQHGLAGFDAEGVFDEKSTLRLHQTVARTQHGTMIVRLLQNRDGAVLPPDLGSTHLMASAGLRRQAGSLVTLLDIDHYCEWESAEFEEDQFMNAAWGLKNDSYRVFSKHAVTPHALEVWK